MKRLSQIALLLIGFSLTATPALAGSFSSDFNSGLPSGTAVYGNAIVDTSGGLTNSGVLKLTSAANSQIGSFIIDDLDPSQRISSYTVSFKLLMGGGTAPPADGISFNFATDLPNSAFNEEGAGSGLTITFDCYDNGAGDNPEGPEFRVKYAGALIANRKVSNQFRTGATFVDAVISYTSAGTITLIYNGVNMFTNLSVGGPLLAGARFAFGARTGGLNQNQFIDDLNVSTTPVSRFYVKGAATPTPPVAVNPDSPFQVTLQDFNAAVDPNSVSLEFDGFVATPSVTKSSGITTISYDPPGPMLSNSFHHANVTFSDSFGPGNMLQYDFDVASAPLWSLAPGSRAYITTDASSTPNQRSIAYNALSNHIYVVSRTGAGTGLTLNVLDAATGTHLYQLNTNGITGGSIILLAIAVADDGAIYAANMVANTFVSPFKIYRWTNAASSTIPLVVYSGDPGTTLGNRWGDSLNVRGTGTNTQLILDATNSQMAAILAPTDSSLTNFVPTTYNHGYAGNTVGRSLQFGPTNTFFLKKKSAATPPVAMPLNLIRYESAPSVTTLISMPDFHPQLGPVAIDLSRGLAAGIFFVTNSALPDRLIVFDISNLNSPFQIAQYNFPVNHQPNANFIGEVAFAGDRIVALEGNNGMLAVPAALPTMPHLNISMSGSTAQLSWSNSVASFILQASLSLAPAAWTNVALPVTLAGSVNTVSDPTGGTPRFYRLIKP